MTYINRVNTGGKVSWTAQSLNAMIDSVNHRKRTGLHRIAPHFPRQASVVSAYYVSGFGEKIELPIKAGTALDLLPYSDYAGLVAVTKHDTLIDRGSTLPFVICVNDVDDENAVFNVAVDGPVSVALSSSEVIQGGVAVPNVNNPSVFDIVPQTDKAFFYFPPVVSTCGKTAIILLGSPAKPEMQGGGDDPSDGVDDWDCYYVSKNEDYIEIGVRPGLFSLNGTLYYSSEVGGIGRLKISVDDIKTSIRTVVVWLVLSLTEGFGISLNLEKGSYENRPYSEAYGQFRAGVPLARIDHSLNILNFNNHFQTFIIGSSDES